MSLSFMYMKKVISREKKYVIRVILGDFLSEFPKILQLLTIYIHSSLKISAQHRLSNKPQKYLSRHFEPISIKWRDQQKRPG